MTDEEYQAIRRKAKRRVAEIPSFSFNEKVAYIDGYTDAAVGAILAIENLAKENEEDINEDGRNL